jgi:hypothetical protein
MQCNKRVLLLPQLIKFFNLSAWRRIVLEKLTAGSAQLKKELPTFYGT